MYGLGQLFDELSMKDSVVSLKFGDGHGFVGRQLARHGQEVIEKMPNLAEIKHDRYLRIIG